MAIFVRPDGDQSNNNWTSAPLWSKINQAIPDDAALVQSENDPANDIFEVTLENQTDPAQSVGHIVRYRMQKGQSGGGQPGTINAIVGLYEATTLIASQTESNVSTGFATFSFTLSAGETDSISDYDDLRVRVDADKSAGARTSWLEVSGIEFETPSAPAVLVQLNFRGRIVNANAAAANAAFDGSDPALNADFTADSDTVFRIRYEMEETASADVTDAYELEYRVDQAGGSSYGAWTTLTFWEQIQANRTADSDTPIVGGTQAEGYAEAAATTNLISGSSRTFQAGEHREASPTGTITNLNNEHTEFEFAIWIPKTGLSATATVGHNNDASTWQFRIVRDDGTVLDTYTNTPTVTLNHVDGHLGGQHAETSSRIGPHKDSDGNLYTVMEPTDEFTAVLMMKSADGGVSWAEIDAAGRPTVTDLEAVDIRLMDDVLHVLWQPGATVQYSTFHTAAHATTPDTWVLEETVATGLTENLEQSCAIEVNSSDENEVIAFFSAQSGGQEVINYRRRSSGGTWDVSSTEIDQTGSDVFSHVVTTSKDHASDDFVAILYIDDTNADLYFKEVGVVTRVLTSDGSRTQIETDLEVGSPGNANAIMAVVYYDSSGTDKVMVGYVEATGEDMETRILSDPWGTISVGTEQKVSDAAILFNTKDSRMSPGHIAMDGTTAHAFFVDQTSEDLLRATNADGAGWGTPVTMKTGSIHWASTELYTHSSGNGGATVIGIINLDYLFSDFAETAPLAIGNGHIEYDELIIATGATVYPPFPRQQRRAVRM